MVEASDIDQGHRWYFGIGESGFYSRTFCNAVPNLAKFNQI